MKERSARELLREVNGAGLCAQPVRLSGLQVDRKTGELRTRELLVACKDRRASVCPACSYLYKADAWILTSAGLIGGKGVDPGIGQHPRLFLTLTAPSFGSVHRSTRSTGACHPRPGRGACPHGMRLSCQLQHDHASELIGTPLCTRCFGYERAVQWNAMAPRLWQRTVVRLRQRLAASASLSAKDFRATCCLTYLKVAELQRRGLVHFHAVVRLDGGQGPSEEPPEWLNAGIVAAQLTILRSTVVLRGQNNSLFGWGREFDVHELDDGDDPNRVAAYVAKYATKTAADTEAIARPFRSRRAIEHARISEHARALVLAAWDLGGSTQFRELRLREHAHTFGFPGQLLTKSRSYSTTFRELRAARARHMTTAASPLLLEGSFGYVSRGYEDPRGETVARFLHDEERAFRKEIAARDDSRTTSRESRTISGNVPSVESGCPDSDRERDG